MMEALSFFEVFLKFHRMRISQNINMNITIDPKYQKLYNEVMKRPEWSTHPELRISSWLTWVSLIKSQHFYMNVAAQFLEFKFKLSESDLGERVEPYTDVEAVTFFFAERKASEKYKATSLISQASALSKFFKFALNRDLYVETPLLTCQLTSWQKEEDGPEQAPVFSPPELLRFYEDHTIGFHNAHVAPYAIVATHGCGRSAEVALLRFDGVVFTESPTPRFVITMPRLKNIGTTSGGGRKKGRYLFILLFQTFYYCACIR